MKPYGQEVFAERVFAEEDLEESPVYYSMPIPINSSSQ